MGIKTLFSHPIFSVLQRTSMFGGKKVTRTYIDMAPAVMVIAIDKANQVHLLREYMGPTDQLEDTFVKGRIDEGETPQQAAARELAEELGMTGRLTPLMRVSNQPSHSTAITYVFVARDCELIQKHRPKGDEEAGTVQPNSVSYRVVTKYATTIFKCVRCIAAAQALRLQDLGNAT